MIHITTKFEYPSWLDGRLDSLKNLDFSEPMKQIGRQVEKSTILNYTQQRQPDGTAWLPSQRAQKDGGKTLIDTGRMLASLTMVSGKNYAEVGYPDGDIPRWLHFGVPENNLPAREHLGLRAEDEIAIERIFADYFTKLFQAA